jgi:GMP reductase
MSSKKAIEKHTCKKMDSYRSSEGRVVKIPYKGPLDNTILNILGGIRSACTYIGSASIKDLPKCSTFVRVNNQLNTSLQKYSS